MLLVARKNLFSERTRLAISVGGVALAVFLISLLLSLYRGWDSKIGGWVEHSNIDLWIGSEGVNDFLGAASILPTEGTEAEQADRFLSTSASVEKWSPLIARPMIGIHVTLPPEAGSGEPRGTQMNIHLIGYDTEKGLGGPITVVEGKTAPGPGEIIVDKALTKRYGVEVGDIVAAGGRDWNVVGISDGGDFVAAQTVFVSLDEAQETLNMEGLTTFIVIKLMPEIDAEKFADDNRRPGLTAFTRDEFASNTRDRILGEVLPIIAMVLALAFIVGLAVAGLTIYTATVEKAREYGILKAVGFPNRYLYRAVLEQSVVTGFLGFVIGVGLTLIIGPFASDVVPQFVLFTRWQDILGVAGVTVLMSAIAAYVPVRRLAAIDPVAVFKA